MALRVFDLTEPRVRSLTVVDAAPKRRQDVRRTKRRWAWLGVSCLAVPFVAAVIVIGVMS